MAGPLGQEMQCRGLKEHKESRGLAAGPGASSKITHKHTRRHSISLSDLPLT